MTREPGEKMCDYLGRLAGKLAEAAMTARAKSDEVHAIFFAMKASETLQLAKHLGFKPDARRSLSAQHGEDQPVNSGDSVE